MSFEAHNLPKHNFTSVSSSQILQANIFRRAHNESNKSSVSIYFFTFFFSYSVQNWSSEFRKWLGNERLKVYTVNSDKRVKVKNEHMLGGGERERVQMCPFTVFELIMSRKKVLL